MRYRDDDDRVSSRRSYDYWNLDELDEGPLRRRLTGGFDGTGFYGYMLLQDVEHLFPWGRGLDEGFTATIEGDSSSAISQMIRDAFPSHDGARGLEDSVRQFFGQTAQQMVGWGAARYEIEFLSETRTANPTGFRLAMLRHGSFGRHRGKAVQFVPPSASENRTRRGLHYVELDPEAIATFALPRAQRAEVSQAVAFLVAASEAEGSRTDLLVESAKGYSFTTHAASTRELLLEATRPIGWTARGVGRERELDPFLAWRNLRFARFKAQLREQILSEFNRALTFAGARIGFGAQLAIDGTVSVEDFDVALDDLVHGRRPLAELVVLGP